MRMRTRRGKRESQGRGALSVHGREMFFSQPAQSCHEEKRNKKKGMELKQYDPHLCWTSLGKEIQRHYEEGKRHIVDKSWEKAMEDFLAYSPYANLARENKIPVTSVIPPKRDKHLEYLELLVNKLREKKAEEREMEGLYTMPEASPNPYTALKLEWRKQYPFT